MKKSVVVSVLLIHVKKMHMGWDRVVNYEYQYRWGVIKDLNTALNKCKGTAAKILGQYTLKVYHYDVLPSPSSFLKVLTVLLYWHY